MVECSLGKAEVTGSIPVVGSSGVSVRTFKNDITLLVFNYSNDVYISNLAQKIKLTELENYLKIINGNILHF